MAQKPSVKVERRIFRTDFDRNDGIFDAPEFLS